MIDALDERLHAVLLGRPVREPLTAEDQRAFRDQTVLVTGAGGSIGSVLSLEIASCRPKRLVLFEQSEYHLFWLERLVRETSPHVSVEAVLGDVTRSEDVDAAMAEFTPDVVYHAAAYKHVTMCERAICPAIRTNVFGTRAVARAATDVGARFVLVSTDKAAQATSVMGATKRFAELIALAETAEQTRAIVVRFGNVLGSRGSLLELVADRVSDGRPVEVTHREATRYFMTPREAASLLMKADLIGEPSTIYWLDMGQPVKVLDIVERAVAWAVERGAAAVPTTFIGLRPGEKLREELTTQGLRLVATSHTDIWSAHQPAFDDRLIRRIAVALRDDIRRGDAASAILDLQAAVPEFTVAGDTLERAVVALADHADRSRSPQPVAIRVA